jgi:excinuclease UvrABC nuclease subunit
LINITIPEVDRVISKSEIQTIPPKKAGLYFMYDKDNKLLYIGKSTNLKVRVKQHVKGHEFQTAYLFAEEIEKISIVFITCPMELDIYETYLINTLKPTWNEKKTFLYTPKHVEERQKQREAFVKEQQELEKKKYAGTGTTF